MVAAGFGCEPNVCAACWPAASSAAAMAAVASFVAKVAASVYEFHLQHVEYVCQAFTAIIAFVTNVAFSTVAIATVGEASIIIATRRGAFTATSSYCYLASCCLPW